MRRPAIILWNTCYIERALSQLENMGLEVRQEDVERIWPVGFQYINILGHYSLLTYPGNSWVSSYARIRPYYSEP